MYGETDVFKRVYADQLVNGGTLKNSKVLTLKQTGHHAYIDNTEGVLKELLVSYFERETA